MELEKRGELEIRLVNGRLLGAVVHIWAAGGHVEARCRLCQWHHVYEGQDRGEPMAALVRHLDEEHGDQLSVDPKRE